VKHIGNYSKVSQSSEFFNPINAFRPNRPPPNTNISDYCQNSSSFHNEPSSNDYIIRCMKYFFTWNNIIDTLTNAIQWHQITAIIFKMIFLFNTQMAKCARTSTMVVPNINFSSPYHIDLSNNDLDGRMLVIYVLIF
jgi:hypothetical protein